ncbi:hypothetical protein RUND412_006845, partial [Rhizina undulata]
MAFITPLKKASGEIKVGLVVSTNTFDIDIRNKQHANAIGDVAKKADVGRVYYTSLALGGYGQSDIDVQASHLYTEEYLEGFEPTTKSIHIPGDSPITFAARTELAEANPRLFLGESHKNSTSLLSGPEAIMLRENAELISETLNLQPPIEAGKREWFARYWATTYASYAALKK